MLLERKAVTNLDSIFRSRGITYPTKVYSQSYGYGGGKERDARNWEIGMDIFTLILCIK